MGKQLENGRELIEKERLRLPSFDWDKVKDFYYVAKFGSISEASKFLNITQPSISRKIKILEYHLKCELLIRLPYGIRLTPRGEQLLEVVEQIFVSLKGFIYNTTIPKAPSQRRKIRIASTHAISAYVLNRILLAYSEENPHLDFELIGDDRLVDIHTHEVDIAIRPIDPLIRDIPKEQGTIQEFLLSLEKKLYADLKYLKKFGNPQSVEDLKNHRLLALNQPEKHPYSDVNWILGLGMPSRELNKAFFTSNSVECLIKAAIGGLGIVSSYDEYDIIRDSNLINILPHVKCTPVKQYFIYPNYYHRDEEIMKVKDYIKENLYK